MPSSFLEPSQRPASGLRIREAVRALIVDPADRILLVEFRFPNAEPVWATPGGGLDPDESPAAALSRELAEELGMRTFEIGPVVWERTHIIPFVDNSHDGQHELFFFVRISEPFEPVPEFSWEQLNAEYVFSFRWWTVDEICSSESLFAPRRLGEAFRELLAGEDTMRADGSPVDVGV